MNETSALRPHARRPEQIGDDDVDGPAEEGDAAGIVRGEPHRSTAALGRVEPMRRIVSTSQETVPNSSRPTVSVVASAALGRAGIAAIASAPPAVASTARRVSAARRPPRSGVSTGPMTRPGGAAGRGERHESASPVQKFFLIYLLDAECDRHSSYCPVPFGEFQGFARWPRIDPGSRAFDVSIDIAAKWNLGR